MAYRDCSGSSESSGNSTDEECKLGKNVPRNSGGGDGSEGIAQDSMDKTERRLQKKGNEQNERIASLVSHQNVHLFPPPLLSPCVIRAVLLSPALCLLRDAMFE